MKFLIELGQSARERAPHASFVSLEQASAALREALGWADIRLGPGYTAADGTSQTWFAYRTQAECDQDSESPELPHITRVGEAS